MTWLKGICWDGDHSGNLNFCVKVTQRSLFDLCVTLRVKLTMDPYRSWTMGFSDVAIAIESIVLILSFDKRSPKGQLTTFKSSFAYIHNARYTYIQTSLRTDIHGNIHVMWRLVHPFSLILIIQLHDVLLKLKNGALTWLSCLYNYKECEWMWSLR